MAAPTLNNDIPLVRRPAANTRTHGGMAPELDESTSRPESWPEDHQINYKLSYRPRPTYMQPAASGTAVSYSSSYRPSTSSMQPAAAGPSANYYHSLRSPSASSEDLTIERTNPNGLLSPEEGPEMELEPMASPKIVDEIAGKYAPTGLYMEILEEAVIENEKHDIHEDTSEDELAGSANVFCDWKYEWHDSSLQKSTSASSEYLSKVERGRYGDKTENEVDESADVVSDWENASDDISSSAGLDGSTNVSSDGEDEDDDSYSLKSPRDMVEDRLDGLDKVLIDLEDGFDNFSILPGELDGLTDVLSDGEDEEDDSSSLPGSLVETPSSSVTSESMTGPNSPFYLSDSSIRELITKAKAALNMLEDSVAYRSKETLSAPLGSNGESSKLQRQPQTGGSMGSKSQSQGFPPTLTEGHTLPRSDFSDTEDHSKESDSADHGSMTLSVSGQSKISMQLKRKPSLSTKRKRKDAGSGREVKKREMDDNSIGRRKKLRTI